MKQSILSFI